MKKILSFFKFTKASLFTVLIIFGISIYYVATNVGFDDNTHITISSLSISAIIAVYVAYFSVVMASYYKLPKNRRQDKMGVLFVVDTHDNSVDYKSIKDKLYDYFGRLSDSIHYNELNPVILTEKQVSVHKSVFIDKISKQAMLRKTKCKFGVFIAATETGSASNKYELSMVAGIVHSHLEPKLEELLQKNLDYIFTDLKIQTVDKSDDLKQLQSSSARLFLICQLVYATAISYAGHSWEAMQLYNDLYKTIANNKDSFCKHLQIIISYELFSAFIRLQLALGKDYRFDNSYDLDLATKSQQMASQYLNNVDDDFRITYYLNRAILMLLMGNRLEAQNVIKRLASGHRKIAPNQRVWDYSSAFLEACEDNPKKYISVIDKYKALKYNLSPATNIRDFIFSYQHNHAENLGVKIALYSLIYYRDDLDLDILPSNFKDEIREELVAKGLNDVVARIDSMI